MIFNQLVDDIRDEPCLWSLKSRQQPEDQDRAWRRVAGKNKLSSLEVKLIFRELSKKYKEERKKPNSTWKLLESLKFLDEEPGHEVKSLKPPTLHPAPQQAHPQTFSDNIDIKEEPITTAQNTSDDDYVELLEVRDEFSDEDMDIDDNTRMRAEKANSPKNQPELGQQNKPNTQNKSISILQPSAINNIKPQTDSLTNIATHSTMTMPMPAIFSNLKRKLAGESHLNGSANTAAAQEPPEKQLKSNLDKSIKRSDFTATTVTTRISPSASSTPPQTSFDSSETSPASPIIGRISPPKSANFSSDSNSGSIAILGMEANNGGLNIGDVIPMSKIKTEKADDVVLENIPIQMCGNLTSLAAKPPAPVEDDQTTTNQRKYSTPHSRRHESFGQYVANTLTSLPEGLANKLEIKILEAIIATNMEKNSSA